MRVVLQLILYACATILSPGCDDSPAEQASHPPSVNAATASTTQPEAVSAHAQRLQAAYRLIQAGRFDDAQRAVDAAAADIPDHPRVLLAQALIHHKKKQYNAAAPWFERAEASDAQDPMVAYFYGYCLLYLGELDAARARFERYTAAQPDEADGHFGLGVVALEQGRLEEAADEIRRAIQLTEALNNTHPQQFDARRNDLARYHCRLGDVYFAGESYEAARDTLLRSIELDHTIAPSYHTLSQVYRRLGDDETADEMQRAHDVLTARPSP